MTIEQQQREQNSIWIEEEQRQIYIDDMAEVKCCKCVSVCLATSSFIGIFLVSGAYIFYNIYNN